MSYGWKGKKVKHTDGREGVIVKEDSWFGGVDLHIAIDGGGQDCVKLNAQHQDGGTLGWSWWCDNFTGGAQWLPLGDHN